MASSTADRPELPDPINIESTDGVTLAVYDVGGSGPDILFAHATGFCAGVFLPLIRNLGVGRIVALDFRGHGRSSVPATSMDWNGTADDVLATVAALDLVHPFGVGHSMGGAALTLAEQASPGLFSGLWLFEPIIFPSEFRTASGSNPLVEGALRRRFAFEDAATAIANFSSKPPLNALSPDALEAYVRYGFDESVDGTVTLRCRPETESATYEGGPLHHAFDHLDAVKHPVVIARGMELPMTPASLAPQIVTALPDARLEEHPTLGHFGPLEAPAAMAEAVTAAFESTRS